VCVCVCVFCFLFVFFVLTPTRPPTHEDTHAHTWPSWMLTHTPHIPIDLTTKCKILGGARRGLLRRAPHCAPRREALQHHLPPPGASHAAGTAAGGPRVWRGSRWWWWCLVVMFVLLSLSLSFSVGLIPLACGGSGGVCEVSVPPLYLHLSPGSHHRHHYHHFPPQNTQAGQGQGGPQSSPPGEGKPPSGAGEREMGRGEQRTGHGVTRHYDSSVSLSVCLSVCVSVGVDCCRWLTDDLHAYSSGGGGRGRNGQRRWGAVALCEAGGFWHGGLLWEGPDAPGPVRFLRCCCDCGCCLLSLVCVHACAYKRACNRPNRRHSPPSLRLFTPQPKTL
jgi:hypothetical protein